MRTPRNPKFEWGQRVIADAPLFNDGSYPDCEIDTLLVEQGTAGEIIQIGQHVELDIPVYMVAFSDDRILGCLEEELVPA